MNCILLHGHDVTIYLSNIKLFYVLQSHVGKITWKRTFFPTTQCHHRSLYLGCFLHAASVKQIDVGFWKNCESFCLTDGFQGFLSFGMRKIAQASRVEPMDTNVWKGDSSFGTHDFQVPFLKFRSYNSNFKGPQSRWLCKLGIGACVT